MRFDSISHLALYFVAFIAIIFALKILKAFWHSKKANIKASLLGFFTRLLSNEQQAQMQTIAVLPTGYPADSMATAHADLAKLGAFLKAK